MSPSYDVEMSKPFLYFVSHPKGIYGNVHDKMCVFVDDHSDLI